MRILQVSPFAPSAFGQIPMGGSQLYAWSLSKRLQAAGHSVEVYASKYPKELPSREVNEGVAVTRFPCWGYAASINPISFISRELWDNFPKFDVVHAHNYIFTTSNQAALIKKLRRFPLVLHLHGGLEYLPLSSVGFPVWLMKVIYDPTVGAWTMKAADKVISCCEQDRVDAVERFGVDPEKVVSIPNCVDVSRYNVSPQGEDIHIVFIGRLIERKCRDLAQIITLINLGHPEARFTIVSDGYMRAPLERDLKGLPVTFTGYVSEVEIPRILASASVLILPSYSEGFPLVILEAMASGVPVVAYDVGGCWESVKDGKTGYLIPVGMAEEFAASVSRIIKGKETRVSMGKVARKTAEEKYDWSVALRRTLEVYESVS